MTYELLKRLRDSGFPLQPVPVETGREIVLLRQVVVFAGAADRPAPGIFYIPSLADLIDACGNELKSMCRVAAGWECNQIQGATLDAALAELWLTQRATAG
jgi:hypothetical protein